MSRYVLREVVFYATQEEADELTFRIADAFSKVLDEAIDDPDLEPIRVEQVDSDAHPSVEPGGSEREVS